MASSETKIDGVVIVQMSTTGSSYLTPALFYGGMSGSLQNLVDGKSFLVAGDNVAITSQSNGQVVIAASVPAASSSASVRDIFYGDGFDGAAFFDGSATPAGSTKNSSTSYTLNRDVCYTTITVNGTVTVNTNAYRVFCNTYAAISGTLGCPGNAGGTPAAGSATTGTLGTGGAGGRGQDTSPWYGYGESIGNALGGNGGAGPGGNPGGYTYAPSASVGTVHSMGADPRTLGAVFGVGALWTLINGGAGGAGTNAGSALGGGGGAGGGIVAFAVKELRGTGSITAQGGQGGVSDFGSYFGAGGGGGGVIFLISNNTSSWSGQLNVSGGLPGAASNSSGSAGVTGSVYVFMT